MANRERYDKIKNGNRSNDTKGRRVLRVSGGQSIRRRSSRFSNGLRYDILLIKDSPVITV